MLFMWKWMNMAAFPSLMEHLAEIATLKISVFLNLRFPPEQHETCLINLDLNGRKRLQKQRPAFFASDCDAIPVEQSERILPQGLASLGERLFSAST